MDPPSIPASWETPTKERKWVPDGMAEILGFALSTAMIISRGYFRSSDMQGRPVIVMSNRGRVLLKDIEKNEKLVSAIIATGKDADWVDADVLAQAFRALDLMYGKRLSEPPRDEQFAQGQWASPESAKRKQLYSYFLIMVKKSAWSQRTIWNTLKCLPSRAAKSERPNVCQMIIQMRPERLDTHFQLRQLETHTQILSMSRKLKPENSPPRRRRT